LTSYIGLQLQAQTIVVCRPWGG